MSETSTPGRCASACSPVTWTSWTISEVAEAKGRGPRPHDCFDATPAWQDPLRASSRNRRSAARRDRLSVCPDRHATAAGSRSLPDGAEHHALHPQRGHAHPVQACCQCGGVTGTFAVRQVRGLRQPGPADGPGMLGEQSVDARRSARKTGRQSAANRSSSPDCSRRHSHSSRAMRGSPNGVFPWSGAGGGMRDGLARTTRTVACRADQGGRTVRRDCRPDASAARPSRRREGHAAGGPMRPATAASEAGGTGRALAQSAGSHSASSSRSASTANSTGTCTVVLPAWAKVMVTGMNSPDLNSSSSARSTR